MTLEVGIMMWNLNRGWLFWPVASFGVPLKFGVGGPGNEVYGPGNF